MHNDQSLNEKTVQFIHLGDKFKNTDKSKDTDKIKKTNKENTINI